MNPIDNDEEYRVLFAAAEQGRADIINIAIETLAAKNGGTTGASREPAPPIGGSDAYRALMSTPRDSDGASPLHVASINGHIDATRALLRLGASPQVEGSGPLEGKTPWDVAPPAVRRVFTQELVQQVAIGDEERVRGLLEAGVPPESSDDMYPGDPPLHWAASLGNVSMCELLLSEGAGPNHRNSQGATPLHEASKGGHDRLVGLLLERGADPQLRATGGVFDGKTAMQVSSSDAVADAFVRGAPQPLLPGQHRSRDGDEIGHHQGKRNDTDNELPRSPSDVHRMSQGRTRGIRPNQRTQQPDSGNPSPSSATREEHSENGDYGVEDQGVGANDRFWGERYNAEIRDEGVSRRESAADEEMDSSGRRGPSAIGGRPGDVNRRFGAAASIPGSDGAAAEVENDSRRGKAGLTLGSSNFTLSRFGSDSLEDSLPVIRRDETAGHDDRQPGTAASAKGDEDDDGTGGRPLPLLWPPPQACTLLPYEHCRIPEQVLVILPANGVACAGSLIYRTLCSALASNGIASRLTRARIPPGSGDQFFVSLACGSPKASCGSSSCRSSSAADQGFSLVAGAGMIKIAGTGEAGLYYGVCMLEQLLRLYGVRRTAKETLEPSRARAGNASTTVDIPCCIIRDRPDVAKRCLVVDVRYPLVPSFGWLVKTVRDASRFRFNAIHLAITLDTVKYLAGHGHQAGVCADGKAEGSQAAAAAGGAAVFGDCDGTGKRETVMPRRRSLRRTWSSTEDTLTHHPSGTARQGRRDDVNHEASHGSNGRSDDADEDERGAIGDTTGCTVGDTMGDMMGGTKDLWGWGQLAELEAICREHLVELVPCWTVLPGEETREAQRSATQWISWLSRQFASDEIHFAFAPGVKLTWEGRHAPTAAPTAAHAPRVDGNESHRVGSGARGASTSTSASAGAGTGTHISDDRDATGNASGCAGAGAGADVDANADRDASADVRPDPGDAGSSRESGLAPGGAESCWSSSTAGFSREDAGRGDANGSSGGEHNESLSLTLFLSNLIVACDQGVIVLEGVPPAALASLQLVGYFPVDVAFTLGAGRPECLSAVEALWCDGVVTAPQDLSILLGPACLGYIHGGQGRHPGRRQDVSLTVRGALSEFAGAVDLARRAGCGVQLLPRGTGLPHGVGGNPYYPALLSDVTVFLAAGLCWGLDKASLALDLELPHRAPQRAMSKQQAAHGRDTSLSGGVGTGRPQAVDAPGRLGVLASTSATDWRAASSNSLGEDDPGRRQVPRSDSSLACDGSLAREGSLAFGEPGGADRQRGSRSEHNGHAWGNEAGAKATWAPSRRVHPSLLLVTQLLRIEEHGLPPGALEKLRHCMALFLDDWRPLHSLSSRSEPPAAESDACGMPRVDAMLWAMMLQHPHGINTQLHECPLQALNRANLRALQRRHLGIQEVVKGAAEALLASRAWSMIKVARVLEEVVRTARLLKLSGRLLQTLSFHYLGPEMKTEDVHYASEDSFHGDEGNVPPSPSPARVDLNSQRRGDSPGWGPLWRRRSTRSPHAAARQEERPGADASVAKLVTGLPSSARFDAANRYLEEFRALSIAWEGEDRWKGGKSFLHASLAGLLRLLAHDMPLPQVEFLCQRAVYG